MFTPEIDDEAYPTAAQRWYVRLERVLAVPITTAADLRRLSTDVGTALSALRDEDPEGPTEEIERRWAVLDDAVSYAYSVANGIVSDDQWVRIGAAVASIRDTAGRRLTELKAVQSGTDGS